MLLSEMRAAVNGTHRIFLFLRSERSDEYVSDLDLGASALGAYLILGLGVHHKACLAGLAVMPYRRCIGQYASVYLFKLSILDLAVFDVFVLHDLYPFKYRLLFMRCF